MRHIVRFGILIGLIIAANNGCRSAPSYTQTHKPQDYVGSIFRDAGDLVQSPAGWDSSDLKAIGAVVGATLVIMQADHSVKHFALDHRSHTADHLADISVPFGTQKNVIQGEAGVFALAYTLGDYRIADTAFMALEANFFSHSIMGTMKGTTKRVRPNNTDDPFEFHFLDSHHKMVGSSAFPSGDVTTSFTWASVVAESTDSPTIDVVSYGLAGLVAMQRVYYNAHWTSDVFMAAVVGTCVGQAVVKYNSPDKAADNQPKTSLVPIMTNDFIGAGIGIYF